MYYIFANNIYPGTFLSYLVNTSHFLNMVLELRLENYLCTEVLFYFQYQYFQLSLKKVTSRFLYVYLFADEAFQLSTNKAERWVDRG